MTELASMDWMACTIPHPWSETELRLESTLCPIWKLLHSLPCTPPKSFCNLPIFWIYSTGLMKQWSADGSFSGVSHANESLPHNSTGDGSILQPSGGASSGLRRLRLQGPKLPTSARMRTTHPALGFSGRVKQGCSLLFSSPWGCMGGCTKVPSSNYLVGSVCGSLCFRYLCPLCGLLPATLSVITCDKIGDGEEEEKPV